MNKKLFRSLSKNVFLYIFLTLFTASAFAGGLPAGTSALTTGKTWLFSIMAIIALGYLAYNVIFVFIERKTWGDVIVAAIGVSVAGGLLGLGNYLLSIYA